jgi:hypothetical protein
MKVNIKYYKDNIIKLGSNFVRLDKIYFEDKEWLYINNFKIAFEDNL